MKTLIMPRVIHYLRCGWPAKNGLHKSDTVSKASLPTADKVVLKLYLLEILEILTFFFVFFSNLQSLQVLQGS